MPLCDSLPECHALRTRPYRKGGILYIRAIDKCAILSQDRGPDMEARVWAIGGGFRSGAARVQSFKLEGCKRVS